MMIDWNLIRTVFMVIWVGGMFIALPLLILLVKPMWVDKADSSGELSRHGA